MRNDYILFKKEKQLKKNKISNALTSMLLTLKGNLEHAYSGNLNLHSHLIHEGDWKNVNFCGNLLLLMQLLHSFYVSSRKIFVYLQLLCPIVYSHFEICNSR